MYPRPFPPEIWSQAIQWLPMSDKKTMLAVSHFFHDTVLPFIFSSVKIYVLGGYETQRMLETNNQPFAYETGEKLMRRSCEILLHILVDPKFARIINDITLVMYTDFPVIFEKLALIKALGALRNLRTLRCYGVYPSGDDLGEILQTIPGTVRHILYSTFIPIDLTSYLPNIEYFEYRNVTYFLEIGTPERPSPIPDNILQNLDFDILTHTKLKFLAIDAFWVTRIPVWLCNQLVSLEISNDNSTHPITIDFICHHCPILVELSLTGEFSTGLCRSFPRETTFTQLRSFRFSCEEFDLRDPTIDEHIMALTRFIQAHDNLRRLHLHFPEVEHPQLQPVFDTLANLRCLEVLGLDTGSIALTEAALEHVLFQIPVNLKALQLSMSWDINTGNHVRILTDALSEMPTLRFLHIYESFSHLPLSPAELAIHLTSLTRIGITRALWDIDRSGPRIVSKWPLWKTKFFTESDFDDPDDAWLFKYH